MTPLPEPVRAPSNSADLIVLVVDDSPRSLGALCIELEHHGCTVLVASGGLEAIARLDLVSPDVILMDAMMPGLDGFATCGRIKADPNWSHIPIIFMTGLAETDDIVRGFNAGGVDYVVKPVRTAEVLARLWTHVRNARTTRRAHDAIDIAGHGVVVVDSRGRVAWRSPQAARLLGQFGLDDVSGGQWLAPAEADGPDAVRTVARSGRTLTARRIGGAGLGELMWLLGERAADSPLPSRLASAALTPREAEVLSWIAKGKTNRDVAEILGMSPRTVNKHLEHVYEKLGVENRTAAAALAAVRAS